jgi:hypothetical protein
MTETLIERRRRFDDVMEGVRREIESGQLTIPSKRGRGLFSDFGVSSGVVVAVAVA